METAKRGMQTIAVLGLVAVTAFWGATFVLVKWTVASVDVYYFLLLRFTLAAALMAAIFRKRVLNARPRTVLASSVLGLLTFASFALQTEGLKITSASNSSLISGMYMVLIPLFVLIYPRRRPGAFAVAAVAVSTAGMFLLTRFSTSGLNMGDLFTLGCAAGFAWHIILTGEFTQRHEIAQLVVFQLAIVALLSGAAMLVRGSHPTTLPPVGWLALVVTAVFATSFAFTMQTWAQRVVDPTRTGVIFALEAVFGVAFGWLLAGDRFTSLSLIGACLMVAGMTISELKPLAKLALEKLFG